LSVFIGQDIPFQGVLGSGRGLRHRRSVPPNNSRGVGIEKYNHIDGTRRASTIKRIMNRLGPSAKIPTMSVRSLVVEPS